MADAAENLRTFLLADSSLLTSLGDQCGQIRTLQEDSYPYCVFFRTGTDSDTERALTQTVGTLPFRKFFDIEIVSGDLDEAVDIAERIKTYADGFSGTFGDTTIQGVFIEDHDDDYQSRSVDDDEAIFVQALQVQLIGVT